MVFENSSAVDSIGENEKLFNKEELIKLCWKIYFEKDSLVRRPSSKNLDRYDFEDWLRFTNPMTKKSNVDYLIASFSPYFSDKNLKSADERLKQAERLKMEITRWLNQNLPR